MSRETLCLAATGLSPSAAGEVGDLCSSSGRHPRSQAADTQPWSTDSNALRRSRACLALLAWHKEALRPAGDPVFQGPAPLHGPCSRILSMLLLKRLGVSSSSSSLPPPLPPLPISGSSLRVMCVGSILVRLCQSPGASARRHQHSWTRAHVSRG